MLESMSNIIRLYVEYCYQQSHVICITNLMLAYLCNSVMLFRVLRNCNISGKIPSYIWMMKNLEVL